MSTADKIAEIDPDDPIGASATIVEGVLLPIMSELRAELTPFELSRLWTGVLGTVVGHMSVAVGDANTADALAQVARMLPRVTGEAKSTVRRGLH